MPTGIFGGADITTNLCMDKQGTTIYTKHVRYTPYVIIYTCGYIHGHITSSSPKKSFSKSSSRVMLSGPDVDERGRGAHHATGGRESEASRRVEVSPGSPADLRSLLRSLL